MNYPHTATIRRLVDGANGQSSYADNLTSKCFIQPLDNESSELLNMAFAKGSWGYFPFGTDIKAKDEVVWKTVKYGVRGVKEHDYGNLTHKRVLLEQKT